MPSASAPPSARRQPRLLLSPLSLFHRRPPCLFSLFLHCRPSPTLPSSPTPPPFSSVLLSPDPRQTSLPPLSLSLFILAIANDKRVLTTLTLLRRRRPRPYLHQPAGPSFPTGHHSHRPRPLPSPLFPSRRHRGRVTSTFFPCFLMASSPPSHLHPRPALLAASFSFDVVRCCSHGLECFLRTSPSPSTGPSFACERFLHTSPPPSLPSTLLSPTPVARYLLSPPFPPSPLISTTATVEKTASTSFATVVLFDPGIDLFPFLPPSFAAQVFCHPDGKFFNTQPRAPSAARLSQ